MLCMIDRKSEKRFTQKAWDKIQKGSILTSKNCGYGGIFFYHRAEKIERFLTERNPGPENKEPWAGKRKVGHPNYDPNYIPKHMRNKKGK